MMGYFDSAGGWAALYLISINALTFLAFAWDKHCAIHRRWRVQETTLLFFSFLGGSPFAKLAQRLIRHKTSKQPFGRRLNVIVVVQLVALVLLVVPPLRSALIELARRIF